MLRAITILLLCSVPIGAADEKAQREEFRMSATVQDIVALSNHSGTVIPVDGDPRFAVIMRVDSITPSLTKFAGGATVTFAIHSPSRLFGAADPKSKSYGFVLRRETIGERTRFSSLEVQR